MTNPKLTEVLRRPRVAHVWRDNIDLPTTQLDIAGQSRQGAKDDPSLSRYLPVPMLYGRSPRWRKLRPLLVVMIGLAIFAVAGCLDWWAR